MAVFVFVHGSNSSCFNECFYQFFVHHSKFCWMKSFFTSETNPNHCDLGRINKLIEKTARKVIFYGNNFARPNKSFTFLIGTRLSILASASVIAVRSIVYVRIFYSICRVFRIGWYRFLDLCILDWINYSILWKWDRSQHYFVWFAQFLNQFANFKMFAWNIPMFDNVMCRLNSTSSTKKMWKVHINWLISIKCWSTHGSGCVFAIPLCRRTSLRMLRFIPKPIDRFIN